MNVRQVAYVGILVAAGLYAPVAWSAPRATATTHKPPSTHAYVVKAGDGGWWAIAKAHGVTMEQLLAANHANAGAPVKVGQTIALPPGAHDPSKHAPAKTTTANANAKKPAARPATQAKPR